MKYNEGYLDGAQGKSPRYSFDDEKSPAQKASGTATEKHIAPVDAPMWLLMSEEKDLS